MFHAHWRELGLRDLDEAFDVVIIGGGITGCGIALDASQRGLRTLVVDKGDVASGTSSRSSKLIHGGLRYLKQMQLQLTRQACRERDRMAALNPHLVSEVQFLYPAYHRDRTPGWQVDLGLWMYDQLTGRPDKHVQMDPKELARLAPGLNLKGMERALSYTDCMADDARLTLAVAATAHAYGATVLSRFELMEPVRDEANTVRGVRIKDLETGSAYRVDAGLVVNATGVWTDEVRDRLGLTASRLRPSRGVHIIIPHEVLSLRAAVTLAAPGDGRPVFLIPHPEGILLGTTDLYHDGALDDPRPTVAEIDYLIHAASSVFPRLTLGRTHLRGAFAGLRPILHSHADEPSEASREEDIWEEEHVLSVAGGKLTTWRSTAETAVDKALELLPVDRAGTVAPCATKGTPLAGLAPIDLSARLERSFAIHPAIASAMARRLASLAWHAAAAAHGPGDLEPLGDGLDLSTAELRGHLRWGAVLHLSDLLIRRTRLGMWNPEAAAAAAPVLRPLCQEELGWDNCRWDTEHERFLTALEGWTVAGSS